MWSRWSSGGMGYLKQRVSEIVKIGYGIEGNIHTLHSPLLGLRYFTVGCNGSRGKVKFLSTFFIDIKRGISSSAEDGDNNNNNGVSQNMDSITYVEAKRLMRLVDVETLKMKLGVEGKEVIQYSQLIQTCQNVGIAKDHSEATAFARILDEAGVVLLFRDKVYLHPDKVRFKLLEQPSLLYFKFSIYMVSIGMELVFVGLTICMIRCQFVFTCLSFLVRGPFKMFVICHKP